MGWRLWHWINHRWPIAAMLRLGLDEDIPGGASFAYTLGSATLMVFLLQAVTGVWQLFYYVPTVDHAYDSLNYLRTEVPFGWLIHGLHYWGANAMIILVCLHMARVFLWAAYKAPRELTWLSGVSLLLLTMGLSFSGASLPWDERGYWAVQVGTSIAGTVPVIGDGLKRVLLGGAAIGQLTLSRFFTMHVALLPSLLVFLIGVHLIAFRRFGSIGPWQEAKRQRRGPFWPDQAYKDTVVVTLIFLLLVALSAYVPAPISGPADPVDTSYVPKPGWNFLFLYEALKFFPGQLEPLGTVGLPLLGLVLLASIPFLDRRPERHPLRRPVAMLSGGIAVGVLAALTVSGLMSHPARRQMAATMPEVSATHASASVRRGARAFRTLGCVGCHRINGAGGTVGPDLSHEASRGRSRQWLVIQLRHPQAHNPQSIMPAFATLNDQDVNAMVDYLVSQGVPPAAPAGEPAPALPPAPAVGEPHTVPVPPASAIQGPPGPAAEIIGSVDHGATLFARDCASCHGLQGSGGTPNPGAQDGTIPALKPIAPALFSREPAVFTENLDRVIQHGAVPAGAPEALHMPAFGDTHTLTQQEIADIEAYVLRLNGIDRAQLVRPGVSPRHFFLLVVAVFGLAGLGLGSLRWRARAHWRGRRPA